MPKLKFFLSSLSPIILMLSPSNPEDLTDIFITPSCLSVERIIPRTKPLNAFHFA